MKMLIGVIAIFIVSLYVTSVNAEMQKENGIGFSLSYAIPKDLDIGVGFGVNFTRYLSPNLSLEFAAENHKFDDEERGITFGEVNVTPILGTVQFRSSDAINSYVGIGIGYYLLSFDESSTASDLCLILFAEDCTYNIDNTFGFHISAGFDSPLNEDLSLNVDLRYAVGSADATFELPLSGISKTDEVDINYYKFGVGLKYWFR